MNKPTEIDSPCPFGCDAKIKLTTVKEKFIAKGAIYKGNRWVYQCPICKKSFTTTESDTISMENLKKQ